MAMLPTQSVERPFLIGCRARFTVLAFADAAAHALLAWVV